MRIAFLDRVLHQLDEMVQHGIYQVPTEEIAPGEETIGTLRSPETFAAYTLMQRTRYDLDQAMRDYTNADETRREALEILAQKAHATAMLVGQIFGLLLREEVPRVWNDQRHVEVRSGWVVVAYEAPDPVEQIVAQLATQRGCVGDA